MGFKEKTNNVTHWKTKISVGTQTDKPGSFLFDKIEK